MSLTDLASSQAPNGLAIGTGIALLILSFVMGDRMRWVFALLGLTLDIVVLAKNYSYDALVSGVEGSLDAHRSYAGALLWVAVAQIIVAVGLLLAGVFSNSRLKVLAIFAGLTCVYAALCMSGWRDAYLAPTPDVQYKVGEPVFHWAVLIAMAATLVAAVISLVRRPRPATTP